MRGVRSLVSVQTFGGSAPYQGTSVQCRDPSSAVAVCWLVMPVLRIRVSLADPLAEAFAYRPFVLCSASSFEGAPVCAEAAVAADEIDRLFRAAQRLAGRSDVAGPWAILGDSAA